LEFGRALHYLAEEPGAWHPPVLACSAVTGTGIGELWEAVQGYFAHVTLSGALGERRRTQDLAWLDKLVEEGLREAFLSHPAVRAMLGEIEQQVAAGLTSPPVAAKRLMAAVRAGRSAE
jgi:LAO/AO transport system kinase